MKIFWYLIQSLIFNVSYVKYLMPRFLLKMIGQLCYILELRNINSVFN